MSFLHLNGTTETFNPNYTLTTQNPVEKYALSLELWIIYETASIILMLLAFYIVLALLHYSCVKVCFKKQGLRRRHTSRNTVKEYNQNSSSLGGGRGGSASSTEGGRKKRSDGTGKSARPLRVLCLLAAIFALLRISADQIELATFWTTRIDCKVYQVTVVVLYAVSATFNYTALWVRLRIFFAHPVMKHLASTTIKYLIWLSLAAVVGSLLLNTFIFTITVGARESKEGCTLGKTTFVSPLVRYVILTISTVFAQLLLLSLFLYPLLKHRSSVKMSLRATSSKMVGNGNRKPPAAAYNSKPHPQVAVVANPDVKRVIHTTRTDSESDGGSIRGGNQQGSKRDFKNYKKQKRENRLMKIVLRVLITAIVCVVSDILAAIIGTALNHKPRIANNLLFNVNLLINVVSVLMSFGDWQERLLPICPARVRSIRPSSRATSASSLDSKKQGSRARAATDSPRLAHVEPQFYPKVESTGSLPNPSSPHDDDDVFTDSVSQK